MKFNLLRKFLDLPKKERQIISKAFFLLILVRLGLHREVGVHGVAVLVRERGEVGQVVLVGHLHVRVPAVHAGGVPATPEALLGKFGPDERAAATGSLRGCAGINLPGGGAGRGGGGDAAAGGGAGFLCAMVPADGGGFPADPIY